ncbi:MAG TPA: hypothetical protein VH062_01850 [Polyangiaceae bacterium]|nr:hypothetical protein [Polyangiaceae bacterium]
MENPTGRSDEMSPANAPPRFASLHICTIAVSSLPIVFDDAPSSRRCATKRSTLVGVIAAIFVSAPKMRTA